MTWPTTNATAAAACGIAPNPLFSDDAGRYAAPEHQALADAVKLVPSVVCSEQRTCIEVASAAIRLLEHFRGDIERGSMVAAQKSWEQAQQLVRALGPAWRECFEALTGCAASYCEHGEVVETCERCGDICFGEEA